MLSLWFDDIVPFTMEFLARDTQRGEFNEENLGVPIRLLRPFLRFAMRLQTIA